MEQIKNHMKKIKNADFYLDQQQRINASTPKYTTAFSITFMFWFNVKEMHSVNSDVS